MFCYLHTSVNTDCDSSVHIKLHIDPLSRVIEIPSVQRCSMLMHVKQANVI